MHAVLLDWVERRGAGTRCDTWRRAGRRIDARRSRTGGGRWPVKSLAPQRTVLAAAWVIRSRMMPITTSVRPAARPLPNRSFCDSPATTS